MSKSTQTLMRGDTDSWSHICNFLDKDNAAALRTANKALLKTVNIHHDLPKLQQYLKELETFGINNPMGLIQTLKQDYDMNISVPRLHKVISKLKSVQTHAAPINIKSLAFIFIVFDQNHHQLIKWLKMSNINSIDNFLAHNLITHDAMLRKQFLQLIRSASCQQALHDEARLSREFAAKYIVLNELSIHLINKKLEIHRDDLYWIEYLRDDIAKRAAKVLAFFITMPSMYLFFTYLAILFGSSAAGVVSLCVVGFILVPIVSYLIGFVFAKIGQKLINLFDNEYKQEITGCEAQIYKLEQELHQAQLALTNSQTLLQAQVNAPEAEQLVAQMALPEPVVAASAKFNIIDLFKGNLGIFKQPRNDGLAARQHEAAPLLQQAAPC